MYHIKRESGGVVNQMRYFGFWFSFKDIWVNKDSFFEASFFFGFLKQIQLSVVVTTNSPAWMAEMDRRAPARSAVRRAALPISAKTETEMSASSQCDQTAQPRAFIYRALAYRGCDGAADAITAAPFKCLGLYLDGIVLEELEPEELEARAPWRRKL